MSVTVSGVNATAGATVGVSQIGVAAFDSASFSVTAGFVQLTAVGTGISSILTDSGAPAVTHTAGGVVSILSGEGIDVTGQGPGTTVTVSGTYATTILKGIAAFDSGDFTVSAGVVTLNASGAGQTLTGDSGGARPPTGGNWDLVGAVVAAGTSPLKTAGAASTITFNVQTSQAIAAADDTKIGLSNFDSSSFAVAATGFVTLSTTGVLKTLTGNSGGAISPTANNINTLGTGSITIAGAGSTLTTQLTGLTANSVLYGQGTATIGLVASGTTGQVLQTNTGAAPTYSTATYPSTTTVSQILYSSATNVVSGLATANRAVITTGATGIPVATALAVDGQLIIGSTAGAPAAATLTAGTGISIVNAGNSISISSTAVGLTWTVITIDQTAAVANGYICNKGSALVLTLPATAAIGDIIRVTGINTALGWKIAQNANQQINFGAAATTVGITGFVQSTAIRDSLEIVCVVAGASTIYNVLSFVGNPTIA